MPKKIIEREIVDEDESIEGSEHEIEYTEVEPKQRQKKELKPKPKAKKEKSIEELVAIELNKRNRTANATKAKVERYDQSLIDKKVQERLQEVERKKNEKKQFESLVEQTVMKYFQTQPQPQIQYQEAPKPRRQTKAKPKQKAPPKQARQAKQPQPPQEQQQQQQQYYPATDYNYPNYSSNSLRTLFM